MEQLSYLLEQLDWFFTSSTWISLYPNTIVLPLARRASDREPCVVSIDTAIPKSKVFRFENYWVNLPGFMDCVSKSWSTPICHGSAASIISKKFKHLRYDLKQWRINLSSIKKVISQCSTVILGFDSLEELRPLTLPEFNFRKIVKLHHENLLRLQYIYWKQRYTIRYIKVGEENSKFFHAMASERMRKNSIASLRSDDDVLVTDHDQMAGILWQSFKSRMGQS